MKMKPISGGIGRPARAVGPWEKRSWSRRWEKRIFGIHVAMMGLSNHLGSALPDIHRRGADGLQRRMDRGADLRTGAEAR